MSQDKKKSREKAGFKDLRVSKLYCPRCDRAMSVKVRPEAEEGGNRTYTYLCVRCGTVLGAKTVTVKKKGSGFSTVV